MAKLFQIVSVTLIVAFIYFVCSTVDNTAQQMQKQEEIIREGLSE